MVAVAIFSVVILSLVGLSLRVAKYSTRATDQALNMARLLTKMDAASTTTFDSLSTIAVCDTTVSNLVKVIGCTRVTSLSARLDSIQVIVWTTLPGTRPDTINLQRSKAGRTVPLR